MAPDGTASLADCPVTIPVAAPEEIGDQLFGSAAAHGNDGLWVGGLGADGVITPDPENVAEDGSSGWKFGWWRIAPGDLTITGRRLDARAQPLQADIPRGFGPAGFQSSGVSFPTAGCWEVTGTVGDAELTFVTLVEAP